MYRVLAVVLMAYAICYPRAASQTSNESPYGNGPTRAERLAEDLSAWLQGPIERVILALNKPPAP